MDTINIDFMGKSEGVTACYFRNVTETFYVFCSQRLRAVFSLNCHTCIFGYCTDIPTLDTPQRSEIFGYCTDILTLDTPQRSEIFSKLGTKILSIMIYGDFIFIK